MMKSKKRQSGNDADQSGIRVLTVSLFIILLAFFVVLNSIAVVDERRKIVTVGSLLGSFGILPGGLSPMKGEGKNISPAQSPMVLRKEDVAEIFGLDRSMSGLVSIRTSPKGNVISIQEQVIFDEGSYKIKPSSYVFLKKLCEIINQDKHPVEITGHTDSRPADDKSLHSNWEFSAWRALEVLKFFVMLGEVDPARLTAYGRAEYEPIASNETRETRAKNRRIDIILDNKSGKRLNQIYQRHPSRFFVFKRFLFRMFDEPDSHEKAQ
ncbi:MAG: hypothetical protein DRH17_01170 [Deltaproteobacteria bacterium]|nr:MAG: hypothetical protein DRH17_01170 [Deltaproteobacteria bacterium]